MSKQFVATIIALAALVAASSVMPVPAIAQRWVAASTCPDNAPAVFHRCAMEAAKAFDPARTLDGRPDMGGSGVSRTGTSLVRTKTSKNIPESSTKSGARPRSSIRRTERFRFRHGRTREGRRIHNDTFTTMRPAFSPGCQTPCITERNTSFFRLLTIL